MSRRCLFAAAVVAAWLGAPPPAAATATVEEARYVMGTMAEAVATATDAATAAAAVDSAFAVFARIDSLMSTWRDDSALSRLNSAPAGRWIDVGRETAVVLARARDLAADTHGAFDPTVLPLVRMWGFRGGEPSVPAAEDLARVLQLVDWRELSVEPASGLARLGRAGMAADLGGIAKGYALAAAAAAMRRAGALAGRLDLGGNLHFLSVAPGADIALVDPRDGSRAIAAVPLLHPAVATSGQYERFVVVAGVRRGHVLDPRSGWPAAAAVSVSVQAADGMEADALATAAVVLGARDGLALVEARAGAEAVVLEVLADGSVAITTTSGLAGAVRRLDRR